MKITRTSLFTGKTHIRNIPVTQEQLDHWNNGQLIQHAMPNISADDREFIMTGITPDEWDTMLSSDEDTDS